jgi:drug/metabolite transporter (DMT)-like permease
LKTTLLTLLALVAFAANSLLCRLALKNAHIDAGSFTTIRLISGAPILLLIVSFRRKPLASAGSWRSALALFTYATAFSFAYIELPTATGALLLFGAVQATMISYALHGGERFTAEQQLGLLAAVGGLIALLLPGITAPSPVAAAAMLAAGVAWGVYSLRGRGAGDAIAITAGNFLRAAALSLPFAVWLLVRAQPDRFGIACAIGSGAIASGLGYAIWYTALPRLQATTAATAQLSVPVIAGIGGIVVLGEPPTLRLLLAGIAILGGIALVISGRRARAP